MNKKPIKLYKSRAFKLLAKTEIIQINITMRILKLSYR